MTKRKGPRIIAIGGGKGGVGKTTVAANLALMIGRVGFRVVLVDVDLGAANLHTTLNFLRPRHTLADYLDHKTDDLGSLAVDITSTVRLVAGTSRPGAANLLATERLRLLRGIASIDADVIIVDVGAGTSYTVVDTFAAADHKLLVISPQLTSVHNAYAMLKACVHRVLRRHLGMSDVLEHLPVAFVVGDVVVEQLVTVVVAHHEQGREDQQRPESAVIGAEVAPAPPVEGRQRHPARFSKSMRGSTST